MHVCVNWNRGRYCFFVQQSPNFEWYLRPFGSQKYMPDCRKSHLIFQNFLGEAFQTNRRRFAPLPVPPFQNSWIRPCYLLVSLWVEDYESLHPAVKTSDTLVNRQTQKKTDWVQTVYFVSTRMQCTRAAIAVTTWLSVCVPVCCVCLFDILQPIDWVDHDATFIRL